MPCGLRGVPGRIRMLLQTRTLLFDCAATLAAEFVAPIQCSALLDHALQLAQHTRPKSGDARKLPIRHGRCRFDGQFACGGSSSGGGDSVPMLKRVSLELSRSKSISFSKINFRSLVS